MCMCVESALPSTPASLLKHSFLAVMTRKTFREQPYAVQGSVAAHRREKWKQYCNEEGQRDARTTDLQVA